MYSIYVWLWTFHVFKSSRFRLAFCVLHSFGRFHKPLTVNVASLVFNLIKRVNVFISLSMSLHCYHAQIFYIFSSLFNLPSASGLTSNIQQQQPKPLNVYVFFLIYIYFIHILWFHGFVCFKTLELTYFVWSLKLKLFTFVWILNYIIYSEMNYFVINFLTCLLLVSLICFVRL